MLTNEKGTSLYMAVWLANDEYDYSDNPKEISVTSLIKPIRQSVLGARIEPGSIVLDVQDVAASRAGTAIHDSVENVWLNKEKRVKALKKLGYKEDFIQRIVVNPEPDEILPDSIPVYVEQRTKKEINGRIISGKYDCIFDGTLRDIKNTSVYSYLAGDKAKDYSLQGSIYKWLNPDKVVADHVQIEFVFNDFSKATAEAAEQTGKTYPSGKVFSAQYGLMSNEQTEKYLVDRINTLDTYWDLPQDQLPTCTEEELWLDITKDKHRYYKDSSKMTRATKVFKGPTAQRDLYEYSQKNHAPNSIVVSEKAQAKACEYCKAVSICDQAEELHAQGRLEKYPQLIEKFKISDGGDNG